MEEVRCIKCGRALRDPESISRGMGPECAGARGGYRKRYRSRFRSHGSTYHAAISHGSAAPPTLFTLVEEGQYIEEQSLVEAPAGPLQEGSPFGHGRGDEMPQAAVKDHRDRHQRADMHDQVEQDHFRAFGRRQAGTGIDHQMLGDDQMRGGIDRHEHEHSLDDAKDNRFENGQYPVPSLNVEIGADSASLLI